jgi:hypothetical protein
MVTQGKDPVTNLSLSDAVKLLAAAEKDGVEHVVSLIRDPRDPSRILGLTAMEAGTAA